MTCLNPTTEEVIEGYKRLIARKKRDIAELEKQIYLLHKKEGSYEPDKV